MSQDNSQSVDVFGEYSEFYDLLYSDKDYIGETEYINSLLTKFGLSHPSILEFGSGTGIHGRMLGDLGCQVTGIEKSPAMVKKATQTENFRSIVGDITEMELPDKFDCVVSLFHVVSYLLNNSEVLKLFKNAFRHLNERGLFVFDVWYSPCVNNLRPEIRTKRFSNDSLEILRVAEPTVYCDQNRVDVNYTIFSKPRTSDSWSMIKETHSMRHFSTPEIELFASQSGFELVHNEEFLTSASPTENTWGVCYVLKKAT